jgi:antitoxin (DNA-binding transcriptional repressor) of toxin-antitoxin stability system
MRPLEVAQAGQFAELLQRLGAGEEVVLTDHEVPVARLIRVAQAAGTRHFGIAKDLIRVHDDFEAPLEDFESYTR